MEDAQFYTSEQPLKIVLRGVVEIKIAVEEATVDLEEKRYPATNVTRMKAKTGYPINSGSKLK